MGCVEPLGLLCIGLADERLRSNALLGTTTALQAANFLFLAQWTEIQAATSARKGGGTKEEQWSLACVGLGTSACHDSNFHHGTLSRRWKRCYDTSIHDGAGLACIFHALEAGRKGPVGRFCVFDLA